MPTLNWIGKDKVINHHQDVPFRVLEHKYGFTADNGEQKVSSNSGNIIIHGDNLEALKSLLPEYEGKIKCIYIDPPYNTGNENWVYNDNVSHPKIEKWLGEVVGKEGEDLSRHDKWLCMMYPRLQLLHKLLSDDGVIFISINDIELANLKLICDEIFGINNQLGLITRKQSSGSKNDTGSNKIISTVDYILTYKKSSFEFYPFKVNNMKKFNHEDSDGFFTTRALEMQGGGDTLPQRDKMGYSVYYNNYNNAIKILFDYNLSNNPVYEAESSELLSEGYRCYRPRKRGEEYGIWRWGADTFIERFHNNLVHFTYDRVYMKERSKNYIDKYPDALVDGFLNTQGTNELKDIFGAKVFDFPKPSELIKYLISISTEKDSIVLDSFAGSGTTAHAVLNKNIEDGGNRKFILVEMEEYANNFTAERVKRVMQGYEYKGKQKETLKSYPINITNLKKSESIIDELEEFKKDTSYSKVTIEPINNRIAITAEKMINGKTDGLGGSFDFYELGLPLFDEQHNLNEEVGMDKIREYIWFSETRSKFVEANNEPYLLGEKDGTVYYFMYEKDRLTTLDNDTLALIKTKGEQYIIYADNCLLSKEFMVNSNIIFKKIPRDITRL